MEDQIRMYYLLFTIQFILFFIALTDYSKWKLISFFTITAVFINDNLNMYINDHLRMYTSDYALI